MKKSKYFDGKPRTALELRTKFKECFMYLNNLSEYVSLSTSIVPVIQHPYLKCFIQVKADCTKSTSANKVEKIYAEGSCLTLMQTTLVEQLISSKILKLIIYMFQTLMKILSFLTQ